MLQPDSIRAASTFELRCACFAILVAILATPALARASCNALPPALTTFRGTVGAVGQPFAGQGDLVELSLDGRCDGESSPGFSGSSREQVVTIVFTPHHGGPKTLVTLADNCASLEESRAACEDGGSVARAVCRRATLMAGPVDIDRVDQRTLRFRFPDTDSVLETCTGGTRAGVACLVDADCPGGSCDGGADDDLTLAGPAAIAVTRKGDPVPCDVARDGCSRRPGLLACVDRLFADDGACGTSPDEVFSSFTALPPPNDYSALCTDPIPPCNPTLVRNVRFAIDQDGNLLAPMEWRGVLVDDDAVPVARLLRGRIDVEAFPGSGTPILVPDPSVLSSFSPGGVKIAPIFDPQSDPTDTAGATFFGTADAAETILRIARHRVVVGQCGSGEPAHAGLPCIVAGDCPTGTCGSPTCFAGGAPTATPCTSDATCLGGECGPGLFDFSTRLAGGAGPVLAPTQDVVARDPVPLDGLHQTADLNAFVMEEEIDGNDLNGDGDALDSVVKLADRFTGRVQALRGAASEGRAITRIREGRFSFPALVTSGDVIAFLEPESAQGAVDRNHNGQVFDQLLRVFRLRQPSASGGSPRARSLLRGRDIAVDPSPLVDGRSLALSGGRLFFRVPEADGARRTTIRVSVGSDGSEGNDSSGHPSISADGRFIAFSSQADNLVPGDTNESNDVFVHDALTHETTRIVPSAGGIQPSLSGDGRFVAFQSSVGFLPEDTNGLADIFVHDRLAGQTTRVSLGTDGQQMNSYSYSPTLAADGSVVAFLSQPQAPLPPLEGVFVHDRLTGSTTRIASGPFAQASERSISLSLDGRFVAFASEASDLVPQDTNDSSDVFVHDRRTGETQRVSVSSDGTQGDDYSFDPALSADGRQVSFFTWATNLTTTVGGCSFGIVSHDVRAQTTTCVTTSPHTYPGRPVTNGRFVVFRTFREAPGLGLFAHDLISGDTVEIDVSQQLLPSDLSPAMSADGRFVAFWSWADDLVPQDTNGSGDVFVRGVPFAGEEASVGDVSGDGRLDDVVLHAIDTKPVRIRALCSATEVATAAGRTVFLRPESAGPALRPPGICPAGPVSEGGVDLNGDGDASDAVVHYWSGDGAVENLALAATSVEISESWIAALVSERGQQDSPRHPDGRLNADGDVEDTVAFVRRVGSGEWRNLARAGSAIDVEGSIVAFTVPEASEGRGPLNDDGDSRDDVLSVYDADSGTLRDLRQQAEEFVIGPTGIVAFRTSERKQGRRSLNGDDDTRDDVLQLFVPGADRTINTAMAVTPCRLEACDPRRPYLVLEDTVRFLTLESDQNCTTGVNCVCLDGGAAHPGCKAARDLDGDGKANHLVLQVLSVGRALATTPTSHLATVAETAGAAQPAVRVLAAASVGICASSGEACTTNADCNETSNGDGTCFVPPGGCVRNLGTPCKPAAAPPDPDACADGQFCESTGRPGEGTCAAIERTCRGGNTPGAICAVGDSCSGGVCTEHCAGDGDCRSGAECNDAGQSFQRLVDPLLRDHEGTGATVLIGAGQCVEPLDRTCTTARDCDPGDFCAGGSCRREHGPCRACAPDDLGCTACPTGSTCEARLLARGAADSDGDELPDAIDNCPAARNIGQDDADGDGTGDACDHQTCGNGILEPGESCDDGNVTPGDGCDCFALCPAATGGTIERSRLTLSNLGAPLGDEGMVLSGRIRLSPSVPSASPLVDLVAEGIQVLIEDSAMESGSILDLSRRTASIPGPGSTATCDARDRWSISPDGKTLSYSNRSNELPGADCGLGSARGLRRLELTDDRVGGTIGIRVATRLSLITAPTGPVSAIVVLGTDDAAGASGRCGKSTFDPARCEVGNGGRFLSCAPH